MVDFCRPGHIIVTLPSTMHEPTISLLLTFVQNRITTCLIYVCITVSKLYTETCSVSAAVAWAITLPVQYILR